MFGIRLILLVIMIYGAVYSIAPAVSPHATQEPSACFVPKLPDVPPALPSAKLPLDLTTEKLIKQLVNESKPGLGYSTKFNGSQFLPFADTAEIHSRIFGPASPRPSATLQNIVRRGHLAVPSLLKHLDDKRKTPIPPVRGLMWMSFAHEYDINRRTHKNPPKLPDEKHAPVNSPPHHITVGDLCFVALGQIVNRTFNAARYQPTGGVIVNSTSRSKLLASVARNEWKSLTKNRHRQSLIRDFRQPDHESRRTDAYRRLAYYYPDAVESLVLKQLFVPTFNVFQVEAFVRQRLYPQKDPAKRKKLFDAFLKTKGKSFADGVILQLFDDLDIQEADEQGSLSPPLKVKHDARACLIQLYNYPKTVKSTHRPHVNTWSESQRARFIRGLNCDKSKKIDKAVLKIFQTITDDDYLAIPCIQRLIHKGHNPILIEYCERRIAEDRQNALQLEEWLIKLKRRR